MFPGVSGRHHPTPVWTEQVGAPLCLSARAQPLSWAPRYLAWRSDWGLPSSAPRRLQAAPSAALAASSQRAHLPASREQTAYDDLSRIYIDTYMLSSFGRVQLCATPWTVAHQAPLSLGSSRQGHWSGSPLLLQGIEPVPPAAPAPQAASSPLSHQGSPKYVCLPGHYQHYLSVHSSVQYLPTYLYTSYCSCFSDSASLSSN